MQRLDIVLWCCDFGKPTVSQLRLSWRIGFDRKRSQRISQLIQGWIMVIQRWEASSPGRSSCVAYNNLIWTVANTDDKTLDFAGQVQASLAMLERHLLRAGSDRAHILSVTVLLSDIETRTQFDSLWCTWIGTDPSHWPQRSCSGATLARGLLVELGVVAAPSHVAQQTLAADQMAL